MSKEPAHDQLDLTPKQLRRVSDLLARPLVYKEVAVGERTYQAKAVLDLWWGMYAGETGKYLLGRSIQVQRGRSLLDPGRPRASDGLAVFNRPPRKKDFTIVRATAQQTADYVRDLPALFFAAVQVSHDPASEGVEPFHVLWRDLSTAMGTDSVQKLWSARLGAGVPSIRQLPDERKLAAEAQRALSQRYVEASEMRTLGPRAGQRGGGRPPTR